MSETISFIISDEQLAQVDAQAAREDRNRSQMLRQLIDLGFEVLARQAPVERVMPVGDYPSSGVVPLVCANCYRIFGLVNADSAQIDRDMGLVHFCSTCQALPEDELIASLEAKADIEMA